MGRRKIFRVANIPYHVTVRANNREWFYLPMGEVWSIFDYFLIKIGEKFGVEVHAFVLMSNHLHLVLSTPNKNLDLAMLYFLRESSRSINRTASRINHVFGGPYKWSVIGDARFYRHVLKYVFRNPVKAGICNRVETYPFSSLIVSRLRCAIIPGPFPNACVADGNLSWVEWLNVSYDASENDCLRRALRRREFKISANRESRKIPRAFIGAK